MNSTYVYSVVDHPGPTLEEKITLAVLGVLAPSGSVGNLLVFLAVITSKSLSKDPFLVAFASLSVSDFINFSATFVMVAVFSAVQPPEAAGLTSGVNTFVGGLLLCTWMVTEAHLALIATTRYIYVCHGKSRLCSWVKSHYWVHGWIVLIWAVPGLAHAIAVWKDDICYAYMREYTGMSYTDFTCPGMDILFATDVIRVGIILAISMLSYIGILIKVLHQRVTMGNWAGQQQSTKKEFLLTLQCFFPLLVFMTNVALWKTTFFYIFPNGLQVPWGWEILLNVAGYLHYSCNPIVYVAFNEKLRSQILRLLSCKINRVEPVSSTLQSGSTAQRGRRASTNVSNAII